METSSEISSAGDRFASSFNSSRGRVFDGAHFTPKGWRSCCHWREPLGRGLQKQSSEPPNGGERFTTDSAPQRQSRCAARARQVLGGSLASDGALLAPGYTPRAVAPVTG